MYFTLSACLITQCLRKNDRRWSNTLIQNSKSYASCPNHRKKYALTCDEFTDVRYKKSTETKISKHTIRNWDSLIEFNDHWMIVLIKVDSTCIWTIFIDDKQLSFTSGVMGINIFKLTSFRARETTQIQCGVNPVRRWQGVGRLNTLSTELLHPSFVGV